MEKYCTNCGSVYDEKAKYCTDCGSLLSERPGRQPISNRLRHAVFKKDGYRCRECGAHKDDEGVTLEIDHIIPVAKGGTNDISNLQTLCKDCNRGKYTDEWVGGETDLEVAENEYQSLLDRKFEYEQKLETATNEDDIIEYKYNIKRINETLPEVKEKLRILRAKKLKFVLEQEQKQKKNKLYKKLYVNLTEHQLDLFYNKFHNLVSSRDDIIRYLVDNFSEEQINQLFIDLEDKHNLYKNLHSNLDNTQLELLYNHFGRFNHSKDKLINYLIDNYSEDEVNKLLNKLENEKERQEQLFKKLSITLTDSQLNLFKDKFSTYNSYSRTDLIWLLCAKYNEKEIYQILNRLQQKKDEKDLLFKNLYSSITDDQLELLYNKFDYVERSKEAILKYITQKYSEDKILLMISTLEQEKEKKTKFYNRIYKSINDSYLEMLYLEYPEFNNSKEKIVNYLCQKYNIDEIYSLLKRIAEKQENYNKRMSREELKENLTPERMKFLALLDDAYNGTNYEYMMSRFFSGFTGRQLNEIFIELDDLPNQIEDFLNQKDLNGFCILCYADIYYYYYLMPDGSYERLYSFSKQNLKEKVLSNYQTWYNKNFECYIFSKDGDVRRFIRKICSKIKLSTDTPHEVEYNKKSMNLTSKELYDEVMVHLSSLSDCEPPKDLFKPILNPKSLPSIIRCPNCGREIQRKALRCKYCKTMMNDLLEMAGGELQLYGLDPNEIVWVKK